MAITRRSFGKGPRNVRRTRLVGPVGARHQVEALPRRRGRAHLAGARLRRRAPPRGARRPRWRGAAARRRDRAATRRPSARPARPRPPPRPPRSGRPRRAGRGAGRRRLGGQRDERLPREAAAAGLLARMRGVEDGHLDPAGGQPSGEHRAGRPRPDDRDPQRAPLAAAGGSFHKHRASRLGRSRKRRVGSWNVRWRQARAGRPVAPRFRSGTNAPATSLRASASGLPGPRSEHLPAGPARTAGRNALPRCGFSSGAGWHAPFRTGRRHPTTSRLDEGVV